MTEYISRDDAIKAVMAVKWRDGADGAMAMEVVAGLPAADVRPTPHSQWAPCGNIVYDLYKCGWCGTEIRTDGVSLLSGVPAK